MHTLSDESIERLKKSQKADKYSREDKGSLGEGKNKRTSGQNRNTGSAKKTTTNAPAMKSDSRMIAGANKGSDNIIKKNGGTVSKLKNTKQDIVTSLGTGGYATEEGNKVRHTGRKDIGKQMFSPLHNNTSGGKERAWVNAVGRRHEAIETKYSGQNSGELKRDKAGNIMYRKNKKGKPGMSSKPMHSGKRRSKVGSTGTFLKDIKVPSAVAENHPLMGVDLKGKSKAASGNHHSAGVLAEEAKFTNRMQDRKAANKFKEFRTNSGERDAIHQKIGKDPYGKGKITRKDINAAHNSKKGVARFDGGVNFMGKQMKDHLQSEGNPNAYKPGKVSATENAGRKIGKKIAPVADKVGRAAGKAMNFIKRLK